MSRYIKSGFTLIELVIVVAIIAILAVGVIAALNPVELKKRTEDARTKSTMTELMRAIDRWTSVYGYLPICSDSSLTYCVDNFPYFIDQVTDMAQPVPTRLIDKLLDSKEISSSFDTRTQSDQQKITITYDANRKLHLCFMTTSRQETLKLTLSRFCDNTNSGNTRCATLFFVADRQYPGNTSYPPAPARNRNFCITN